MNKIMGTILGFVGYIIELITKKPEFAVKIYRFADKFDNRSSFALIAHGKFLFEQGNLEDAIKKIQKAKEISSKNIIKDIACKNLALCYWKMNRLNDSIKVMEEIKNRHNYKDKDILTTLGYFYLLAGDYDKAIDNTNEALEEEPEHAPAFDNLGQIYFNKNQMKKAEEYFLKALKNRDDLVDSKYYLGLIYEKWGQKDKAIDFFEKAYNTNSSSFSTVTKEQIKNKCRDYDIIR